MRALLTFLRSWKLAKPLVMLFGIFVIWWLIPMATKSFLRVGFFEFQAPVWTGISFLEGLQEFWSKRNHTKLELYEAGKSLARLNASYELRLQEVEALRAEIARLEALLGLPSHEEYRYEPARVIRRDLSGWWHQLIIRKGSRQDIPKGAGVVYSGGIAGRIKEVFAYTSVVELVSSRSFRIAAHFEGDDRPVTYQGGINLPFLPPGGEVLNIQPDVLMPSSGGKRLVSTNLGGVFPEGLTIGWSNKLTPNMDGLLLRGRVSLDKRLLNLREVAVLIPLEPALQL